MTEMMQRDSGAGQRNRWLLVAVVGLAAFMGTLDTSIVSVAIPFIQQDLHTRPDLIEWVSLSYFLPMVALALPNGRWLDRVGKRVMFALAASGFGLSSIVCGLAPTIGVLIAARIVQGAFGALLFVMTPVLATIAVRPEARGRALSVPTTLGPLGAASGPALGGLLVGQLGWHWIFYVNVPVCIVIVLLGLHQMSADGPLRLPGRAWLIEAVLFGSSVAALLVGLTFTAGGGLGWLVIVTLAVVPLWIWSRLPLSKEPRALLRSGPVLPPLIGLVTIMAAVGLVQYLTPFFLTDSIHLSPELIGITVLAFPIGMAIFGPLSGVISDRWGVRAPQVLGGLVAVIGLALIVPLDHNWGPFDLVWRLALFGIGTGLFLAPNQASVMASVPKSMFGTAGASSSLLRQLGLSLGPAIATLAWSLSGYTNTGMAAAYLVAAGAAFAAAVSAGIRRRPEPEVPWQGG